MPTQSALYARSSTSASTVSSRSADVISTERSRSSSSTTTANATTKALITSSSMAHQRGSVLAGFAGGSVLADFLTTTRVRPDNVRARELIRRLGSLMGHCAIARSQSPTAWKVGSRRGVFGLTSDRPSSCLSATTDKTPIFGFVKRTCRLMSHKPSSPFVRQMLARGTSLANAARATAVWYTNTFNTTDPVVEVQNDSNLVVYTGSTPMWSIY
jgi:hypothetical protein